MGPPPVHDEPTQKDPIASQFDKSISMVQSVTTRLERNYIRPGLEHYMQFFERRPLTAIFLAIFAALSVFPVITFIGLSFSISAGFILVGLSVALFASGAIILALFAALLGVLTATFFAALFLTAVTISSFSFFRFVVLLRAEGAKAGTYSWILETKDAVLGLVVKGNTQLKASQTNGHAPDSKTELQD